MTHLHIIPVGGIEPIHVAHPSCWCHPTPDASAPGNHIHHAKDCRERWERQGLATDPGAVWVTIEEAVTPNRITTDLDIITADHPEANGRKPQPGEQQYLFSFRRETGEKVTVRMGAQGWQTHSQHVLDMLTDAPSYNDESPTPGA